MENIISKVCELSGCSESDVKTRSRKTKIRRARQILMSYNHLVLLKNQTESAAEFGMKHSTVIHCIRTVQNDFKTSKEYREIFGELLQYNIKMLTHRFNHYDKIKC